MKKTILLIAIIFAATKLLFAQTPYLVKDINPGTGNAFNNFDAASYAVFNGEFYFIADDGTFGQELWKTNGTAVGTVMVKDINLKGGAFTVGSAYTNFLVVSNSSLFFMADDSINGRELWKSDGSPAGTVMVKDINPGSASSTTLVYSAMIDFNGILYFNADDGVNGTELWRSDGTTSGTVMVKDINPGVDNSYPNYFTISNGILFFDANNGGGLNLWKTDGTAAGTVGVKDISMTAGPVFNRNIIDVNNTLFLDAYSSTTLGGLWKSDGTTAGTIEVKDINPVSSDGISEMTNVNGTLFFSAIDTFSAEALWKSDGTAGGTVKIKDIDPGNIFSYMDELVNVNGTLFFAAEDTSSNGELWKSDGTTAGTVLVKDINPTGGSNPDFLTPVGNILYFSAFDGGSDNELWKSDGTPGGTVRVADINPTAGSYPYDLFNVNGVLYFTADDGTNGRELWALNTSTGISSAITHPQFAVIVSPNPFSSQTEIKYSLAINSQIKIELYNLLGQKIKTIADEKQSGGEHLFTLETERNTAIYLLKMTVNGNMLVKRLVQIE